MNDYIPTLVSGLIGSVIIIQLAFIYRTIGSYGSRLDGHDRELIQHDKRIGRLEDAD